MFSYYKIIKNICILYIGWSHIFKGVKKGGSRSSFSYWIKLFFSSKLSSFFSIATAKSFSYIVILVGADSESITNLCLSKVICFDMHISMNSMEGMGFEPLTAVHGIIHFYLKTFRRTDFSCIIIISLFLFSNNNN